MSKFSFKKFSIEQDRCAMKIGTDGVLLVLGPNKNPFSILDIGTGTGVIVNVSPA
jgi:tRNA1Val (adenine37-N6)-methyltransferase